MTMSLTQAETNVFRWLLACLMVVVLLPSNAELVTSKSTNRNSTLMRYYCSMYKGTSPKYFLSNLNTTLSSLRRQLLVDGVHYAVARTLLNGESVWGLASCRGYVSIDECVSCYNYAVAQLRVCGLGNGAHAFYNDCDVRYENNNFYADANIRAGVVICGNTTSPQPSNIKRTVEGLMSDLRTAAPRTSNYYAASTRRLANGNVTVYAIAQCNLNLSQSVCQECLKSRYSSLDACLPGTTGRAIDNGCFMRYSSTPFFRLNQTTDITPFLGDGDSSKKRSIIGGVVGGVCFLLMVLAFSLWRLRSKNPVNGHEDKSTGSTEFLQGPLKYSYGDLKVATDNFSVEHRLGGGVFGEVYKGTLKDGNIVAIKKTTMASISGKLEELKIICNVHHRHLIRLLGYCNKGPFLFLVHEYMDNGSLDQFLYDFGMMRLLPEDKTHLSTKMAGSMGSGYRAPEYAIHGQLSEKVDTYSFGIVVLEIISGKRCHYVEDDESVGQSILEHAWNLYDRGAYLNLVDERIHPTEYTKEDAKKMIEIALMCTQSPVSARPAMSEVVTLLSDKSLDEMPHVRPTCHEDNINIKVDTLT